MKCWIVKENDKEPSNNWEDAYIFSISRDRMSTSYSSMPSIWYHLDQLEIEPVYEDLFIVALSVFSIDKRVQRKLFRDSWTRSLEVSIPVLEFERFYNSQDQWNRMLSFLTGDKWQIEFRKTEAVYSKHRNKNRKHIDIDGCNCVSLFSGGLDSFCGAIKLLQEGNSPCLVGHNEYPKLRYIQEDFCKDFNIFYPDQKVAFISFTAGVRAPYRYDNDITLKGTENTSRGRSLLFLCAALTIAGIMGKDIPVYIPENGLIGINVALTNSRKGSCSTRTTHPFFINSFKEVLSEIGINNPVINFFAYKTKREVVECVSSTEAFKKNYKRTISCSHPCVSRYARSGSREYPINCGYCYPCMIRRSSLLNIESDEGYSYSFSPSDFINASFDSDKCSDLQALISSVHQFLCSSENDLRRKIRATGRLSKEDESQYLRVYERGMRELLELLQEDQNLKEQLNE